MGIYFLLFYRMPEALSSSSPCTSPSHCLVRLLELLLDLAGAFLAQGDCIIEGPEELQ